MIPPSSDPSDPADDNLKLWVELANLFFLDHDPQDSEYQEAIGKLRRAGWSKDVAKRFLVEHLAPALGGNVGFLIYPANGEWSCFRKEDVRDRVLRSVRRRRSRPGWVNKLCDAFFERMMRTLDVDRLLSGL